MPFGLPLQYPSTTGARPSFGHLEAKFAGFPILGFKKIAYSRKRTREEARGAHPDPLGKSQGENAYACTVDIWKPEFDLFIEVLKSKDLFTAYGDIFFTVSVSCNAPNFMQTTDTIIGCTLDEMESSNEQGAGPLIRNVALNPLKILFNGEEDVTESLTSINSFVMSVL